jgi:hypothetical protein
MKDNRGSGRGKGWGLNIGKKSIIIFLIVAVLLAACIFPRRGAATASSAKSPAGMESVAGIGDAAAYLRELKSFGFGKYLEAPDAGRTKTTDSGWDIYHSDKSDCRCPMDTDYVLAARRGSESAKTVLLLEGGACFPGPTIAPRPHRSMRVNWVLAWRPPTPSTR